VFLKTPEADSARNVTEDFRQPLSESDSTKRSFSLEAWHPDGNGLLLRAQDGYHVMMEGEEPELVWPFPGEDREAWAEAPSLGIVRWTEEGRYLYASRSARDRWDRGLVRFDLDRRQEETLVSDTDLYRSWTVAEDGSRVVFRRSDGDRPDEVWTASGTFGDPRPLTDLNPWLAEVALSNSRLIQYLDVDGEELYGIVHLPPDYQEGTAYPLVAEIYETFFDNGYSYSAQTLAAQGWIVLRPSVDLEMGFPGEAWLKGVTTAINTLIDQGMVDGPRLGVHGTSYGGYATNLLVTQTDRFAAAVNISGKVNIISFLGDSEKITTRNYNAAEETQDRIGSTLWEQPQKYWAHTAVLYADRIETPLLLLTGHGDWNVPDTNTREMYYALRRLGKEVVWVNYMRAGHGAGRAGTEADYRDHWNRMIEWYRSHFEKALEKEGS
jgi:dipeptidyl aminopeptidase/acylaminoacyl peptidase